MIAFLLAASIAFLLVMLAGFARLRAAAVAANRD
jgi:hypothetical protein